MGDEQKRSGDRRTTKERRSGTDTRTEEEKRLTGERRSQVDRRSEHFELIGVDQRIAYQNIQEIRVQLGR